MLVGELVQFATPSRPLSEWTRDRTQVDWSVARPVHFNLEGREDAYFNECVFVPDCLIAACAAASLAIGTLYGLHET